MRKIGRHAQTIQDLGMDEDCRCPKSAGRTQALAKLHLTYHTGDKSEPCCETKSHRREVVVRERCTFQQAEGTFARDWKRFVSNMAGEEYVSSAGEEAEAAPRRQ